MLYNLNVYPYIGSLSFFVFINIFTVMVKKAEKFVTGQNLRYIGRAFAGYKQHEPYMTYVKDVNLYEVSVIYNNTEITVSRYNVKAV